MNPTGFWRLGGAFLSSRENRNTRAAYARDLEELARALDAGPWDGEAPALGVEDDPGARAAAVEMAEIPLTWWTHWRDELPGSLASRRRRVAGARAFCKWWSRLYSLRNPVAELRPPSSAHLDAARETRPIVALTQSEAGALCETARALPGPLGRRTEALVELLYGSGLRVSEAVGLDMSALQLDDPEDPFVIVHGKGGKERAVSVPVQAREALGTYLTGSRPELRARDRRPRAQQARFRDADAVFLGVRGRRLGRSDAWRIVRDLARAAGIATEGREIFPHALRHSCGTHLIQAGVDIRFVQAHLGHASPVTTEIYTHVTAAHLREDFDRAHPRARRNRLR